MVMRGLGLVGEADGRASGSGVALLVDLRGDGLTILGMAILLDVCPSRAGDRRQWASLSRRARLGVCRGERVGDVLHQGVRHLDPILFEN